MAVTGTSVAAAATMLAAAAAIFITFVLCFYLFLCAKRYRGAAPTIGGAAGRRDGAPGRARFVFAGSRHASGGGGGLGEAAIAALPRREVTGGDPPADCAVCIAEVAAGEAARLLPRCGHAFHVDCVDMWLRTHSTCPLCRAAVVDEEDRGALKPVPEADPDSPNFPTNVLFFGSQDAVSARGAVAAWAPAPTTHQQVPPAQEQAPTPMPGPIAGVAAVVEAARVAALRRLLGCGASTPQAPQQQGQDQDRDLESGLGESSGSPPAKPQ